MQKSPFKHGASQSFGRGNDFLDSGNIMNSGTIIPPRLDLFGSQNPLASTSSNHQQIPINYELFSLKRLVSLSTGTYPIIQSQNDDFIIDTSQWEEISMSQTFWNRFLMKEKRTTDADSLDQQSTDSFPSGSENGSGNPSSGALHSTPAMHHHVGDETFFNNVLKTSTNKTSDSLQFHSPSVVKKASQPVDNISNMTKPVVFSNVVSGGCNSLYNVIACLCSNNVIILRFFGIVKYIDRDDERKQRLLKNSNNEDDDASETESVETSGSTSNNTKSNGGIRLDDEDDNTKNKLSSPIIRCISYFQQNEIEISSIAIEETARWLTCITSDGDIYVVPICRLFFPYNGENSYPFKKTQVVNSEKETKIPSLFDYTLYQSESPNFESPTSNPTQNQPVEALNLNNMKQIELAMTSSSASIKKHQQVQKLYQQKLLSSQSLLDSLEHVVNTDNTKTKRQYQATKHGQVTCSAWWTTFSNHPLKKHYCLFGTDKGFLIVLNIQTLKEEAVIPGFKYGIKNVKIVSDEKSVKFALVACGRGGQYKQILELLDLDFNTFRNVCDFYQTQNTASNFGTTKDVKRDLQNDMEIFKLKRLDQFSNEYPSCSLNTKKFEERKVNMVCCFDKEKHQFSLYDVETMAQVANNYSSRNKKDEIYPLFQYHLSEKAALAYPTHRLLFYVQRGEDGSKRALGSPIDNRDESEYQEKLYVSSRALLTSSNQQSNNTFRPQGVLQEFLLPSNEMVKGILSGFIYKDETTPGRFKDDENPNEIEGTIFWSQTGIYELKQKNSPLKIFEFIISNKQNILKDSNVVDQFGQTFGLDLFSLYEQYADEMFEKGDVDLALHLYKLSNVNEIKYVNRLLQVGRSDQVFEYLMSVLENSSSLSITKRKQLSNLLFECFMHKLIESKEFNKTLLLQFKQFLLSNTDVNPQIVINQLIQYCCSGCFSKKEEESIITIELVLEIAHKHRLMKQTLQLLVSKGYISLLSEGKAIQYLYDNQYGSLTQSVGFGVLLHHCSANTKVKFLLDYLENMRMNRHNNFETENTFERDEYFEGIGFAESKKPSPRNESPIKQQLFFSDSVEMIQYNSKIFDQLVHLIPQVTDVSTLLLCGSSFNPEENPFISKETRTRHRSSSNLVRDPYTKYFHYPYIHLEQHVELYIIALLSLVQLKRKLVNSFAESVSPMSAQKSFNTTDINSLNFSSNSLYTHTQEKLEQCIKYYNIYRTPFIVSNCLKFNNKSALAIIYEKDEMWVEAICCKLVQMKDNFKEQLHLLKEKTDESNKLLDIMLRHFYAIFDRYFANKSNELDDETKLKMLEKLFRFYYQLGLPTVKLEDHCIKNIHIIGDILSRLLLLDNENKNSKDLKQNLKFSHSFYLKITQSYVKNVKRYEREEGKSTKNLTQQILRNMEKDVYKRNFITISHSDIAKLQVTTQDDRLMAFTCNDHFTRSQFTSSILPEFKQRVNQLVNVMPSETNRNIYNTATELILRDYQNVIEERTLHTNQACPICIFNFFLKSEKNKMLKLKPQAQRMLQQQLNNPSAANNSVSEGNLQYMAAVEKLAPWLPIK